jgi:hypothetical protein
MSTGKGMSSGDAHNCAIELVKEMIRAGKAPILSVSGPADIKALAETQADHLSGVHAKLYEYFLKIDNTTPGI